MFEVVESAGEWIVRQSGLEVARFAAQAAALRAAAERMREQGPQNQPVGFAIRFGGRDG